MSAAVVLLHGGRVNSHRPVRPWNLPLARMRLLTSPLLNRAQPSDLAVAVAVLRYRYRGWNGPAADPVVDTRWALDLLADHYGHVPVALVGHSMGARAALRAADYPTVTAVAALAPWVPADEPVAHLAGRTILIAHGDKDRITDPAGSHTFAMRAASAGATVCRLRVEGSGHAMLQRRTDWNLLAADFALGALNAGPMPAPVAHALASTPPDLDMPLDRAWAQGRSSAHALNKR